MRNNETGEFELVVGNRQLLSGFFIVVLLLAVVFAMGYVVGQNSPRSAKTAETAAAPPAPGAGRAGRNRLWRGCPRPVREPSAPPHRATGRCRSGAGANPPADTPPQPSTQPAREPAAAPAPPRRCRGRRRPPSNAAPGSYWQVTASASRLPPKRWSDAEGQGFLRR